MKYKMNIGLIVYCINVSLT
uniref:Uncharacterized protein n=1 Tax=Anguilla anguilla TaxID=7936 RepID=A0A0E9PA97_ANGAN